MDIFDFEELTAEMLSVTDEQRENDDYLIDRFYERFGIDFEQGYELAIELLQYTPKVNAGLSGKVFHAFVSRKNPVMLMRVEAEI